MKWTDVVGFFNDSHQEEYARLINLLPDEAFMVEVGCYRGKSLCSVAEIIKKKRLNVIAIDLFDDVSYTYDEANVTQSRDGMLNDFIKNIEAFGLRMQIAFYKISSVQAAKKIAPKADLVFIDAAHDYDSVKADIEAWEPLVKPGGILCGHDYADYCPGVVEAVKEKFFGKCYVKNEIWSLRK